METYHSDVLDKKVTVPEDNDTFSIELTKGDLNCLCDGDYVMVEAIVEEILNQAREKGWEYTS